MALEARISGPALAALLTGLPRVTCGAPAADLDQQAKQPWAQQQASPLSQADSPSQSLSHGRGEGWAERGAREGGQGGGTPQGAHLRTPGVYRGRTHGAHPLPSGDAEGLLLGSVSWYTAGLTFSDAGEGGPATAAAPARGAGEEPGRSAAIAWGEGGARGGAGGGLGPAGEGGGGEGDAGSVHARLSIERFWEVPGPSGLPGSWSLPLAPPAQPSAPLASSSAAPTAATPLGLAPGPTGRSAAPGAGGAPSPQALWDRQRLFDAAGAVNPDVILQALHDVMAPPPGGPLEAQEQSGGDKNGGKGKGREQAQGKERRDPEKGRGQHKGRQGGEPASAELPGPQNGDPGSGGAPPVPREAVGSVVGWYVRRRSTPLRPSMRETAASVALLSWIEGVENGAPPGVPLDSQGDMKMGEGASGPSLSGGAAGQEVGEGIRLSAGGARSQAGAGSLGLSSQRPRPLVLLVLSSSEEPRGSVHTSAYRLFHIRRRDAPGSPSPHLQGSAHVPAANGAASPVANSTGVGTGGRGAMGGPMHPLLTPLRLSVVNLGHVPRPQYNALPFASGIPTGLPLIPSPSPADARASNANASNDSRSRRAADTAGAQATESARGYAGLGGGSSAALGALAEASSRQVAQTEALYLRLLEELRCACGELLEAQQEARA